MQSSCRSGGMVDTRDLKSLGHYARTGSSPVCGTIFFSSSMNDPHFILGIIGMIFILLSFLLNQLHIWKQDMLIYDVCNAIGSILLIVYAYVDAVWPFVILNAVWAAYSIKDIAKSLIRKHS